MPTPRSAALLFGCAAALAGCGDSPPPAPPIAPSITGSQGGAGVPWFEDRSADAGIVFRHVTGHVKGRYLFPEMSGAGVALFDYDRDGKLDVFLVQSGYIAAKDRADVAAGKLPRVTSKLFRNLGGFRFEDVTEKAGVAASGYGMGASAADYDGDGDVDLLVLNTGAEILYRNEGDGTFTDVTAEAGCSNETWSTHGSFADFDGDGDLDLYVANYINWAEHREIGCKSGDNNSDYCGPNNYKAPAIDSLYRNEGGGKFRDVSREAGLEKAYGNGFGVAVADYDRDGRLDAYVANDGNENQLWLNQGGLRFENKALARGCALGPDGVAQAGMGVFQLDFDENGAPDIFVTNLRDETNALYVNNGSGDFADRIVQAGLGQPSRPFTGFGCGFADFDLDGRLDLYVANGAVMRPRGIVPKPEEPYAEINQLFRGVDGKKFEEVLPRGGTAQPIVHGSRGAAFGDLDDDGAVDVVINNSDAPVTVLRNIAPKRGAFAGLRVVDAAGRDAIGAEVKASFGDARRHVTVTPHLSFCCTNDARIVVGLGAAPALDRVEVRWLDGVREDFGPFAAGAYHEVRRGRGRAP